jgi:membrane protease YdiL (CAAX protease family)
VDLLTKLTTDGNLISIATITSAIFGVGAIILFIKIRKGAGLRDYLGLKSMPKKAYLILLAIVIGLVILSTVLGQVLQVPDDTGFTVDAYKTTTWPALLWLAVAVFAPLFEEIFFRGFLFVGFKQTRMGAAGAIAITSVAWALLHIQYDIYGMATILVLGIVLGIIRLKTKSLWSALFVHSLWNLIAMVMTVLYVNGIIR